MGRIALSWGGETFHGKDRPFIGRIDLSWGGETFHQKVDVDCIVTSLYSMISMYISDMSLSINDTKLTAMMFVSCQMVRSDWNHP